MLGFVRRLVGLCSNYSVSLYFGVWDSWPSHMFSNLFHHNWFGDFVNSKIGAWSIKLQEKQKSEFLKACLLTKKFFIIEVALNADSWWIYLEWFSEVYHTAVLLGCVQNSNSHTCFISSYKQYCVYFLFIAFALIHYLWYGCVCVLQIHLDFLLTAN